MTTLGFQSSQPNAIATALVPIPSVVTAVYQLRILNPAPLNTLVANYVFPLSPTNVSKKFTAMNSFYDVAGAPGGTGVQRIIDQYGNSPVMYTLEGITGWQRHKADGGQLTGLQSILAVQALLNQFATLNTTQQANGATNLYTLEFFDNFTDDYWAVVPIGEQEIVQDVSRPLVFKYLFRLYGYQDLSAAPVAKAPDKVQQSFQTPAPQAESNLSASVLGTVTSYQSQTPGATAFQEMYI